VSDDVFSPNDLENIRCVAIWGASASGESCIEQMLALGIEVKFFIDKNKPVSGQFCGVTVYESVSIDRYSELLKGVDAVFLAMGVNTSVPRAMLKKAGFSKPVVGFRLGASVKDIFNGQLSVNRVFFYDDGKDDLKCLLALANDIMKHQKVVIFGAGKLTRYLLKHCIELTKHFVAIYDDDPSKQGTHIEGVDICLPAFDINHDAIFIASTRYLVVKKLIKKVRDNSAVQPKFICVSDLLDIMGKKNIPSHAWLKPVYNIYPVDIPEIKIKKNLDFVLLDLPARMLGMMPNGLAYVHNILKKTGISLQTLDLDMIIYHRYHSQRILDDLDQVVTSGGYVMKPEPWAVDVVAAEWEKEEVIKFFQEDVEEPEFKS